MAVVVVVSMVTVMAAAAVVNVVVVHCTITSQGVNDIGDEVRHRQRRKAVKNVGLI